MKGLIEPVVGRDWEEKGAGRKLKSYGLFWSPGSILIKEATFRIMEYGLWKQVDNKHNN